jgi:hypothetical protein
MAFDTRVDARQTASAAAAATAATFSAAPASTKAMIAGATACPTVIVWSAGLAVVVLRLLFSSHYLYHWDSVNFALGLERYDVRLGQPHPPGYVLYVALGWLVNLLFHDANRSLVAISAAGSGLLVVTMWRLAERLFDSRRAGALAALLVAGDPLFWFYGAVALPHAADAALCCLVALWLWRIRKGESRLLLPTALLLAVATGFRQQNALYLAPLCAFCLWGEWRNRRWGPLALASALFVLACTAWFVPMVNLSGGFQAYQAATKAHGDDFFQHTSIFMERAWRACIST